ncbi:hypothetical protein [Actinoallomurus acanthiterrae]
MTTGQMLVDATEESGHVQIGVAGQPAAWRSRSRAAVSRAMVAR